MSYTLKQTAIDGISSSFLGILLIKNIKRIGGIQKSDIYM